MCGGWHRHVGALVARACVRAHEVQHVQVIEEVRLAKPAEHEETILVYHLARPR